MPRGNDPAEKLMRGYPEWQPVDNKHHRMWQMTDPNGVLHSVTCGSGTHSLSDAELDAKRLQGRLGQCLKGNCAHIQTQGLQDQQVQEPTAPVFQPGQQIMVNGQPMFFEEMEGNMVAVYDAQGNQDIVTPQDIQPITASVLDKIQETLDPDIFNDPGLPEPTLKPQINKWLHKIIYNALEKHGYSDPQRWLTLVLTGSLTSYQYSSASDFDISLFVDKNTLPEWSRAEMVGIMVKEIDGAKVPGSTHDIQAYVVPSGIKRQDLYQRGLRSGYDLETNRWIIPPEKDRARDVGQADKVEALEALDKLDRLYKFEPKTAVQYFDQLHRRRQKDEAHGKGDFAVSNVIWKLLESRGYVDKIEKLKT